MPSGWAEQSYRGCEIYNDFRDVLARDDIDAIWGCVPDHWHGVVYSRAIEAGKDLYGEKPITRWIADGIQVRDAVRRYGCVFQTGTQQRSDPKFRHACELARNGYLGKVHTIYVGAPGGQSYPAEPPCDPPEGFDYDMWSGPAPYFPFDKKRCEWLAMYMISHYCAGFITNWGVHHLDIAGWGCPEVFEKPFEIEGTGVLPSEGMTDTWISWQTELRWESGLKMSYTNSDNPNKQGCKFEGDEGWVHVNRSGIWAEPASLLDVKLGADDKPLHASPEHANPYTAHTADFFRSMRTRQDPVSPVEAGPCRQHDRQRRRHRPASGTQVEVGSCSRPVRRRRRSEHHAVACRTQPVDDLNPPANRRIFDSCSLPDTCCRW